MAELTASTGTGAHGIRENYLAMTRRKRLYGGLMVTIFVALMASGFVIADERNAGGFWNGILHVFDFPSEVVSEAWAKIGLMPAHLLHFFPALIETINIAAVSTLVGAGAGMVLSLLSTRGLARFPRLIPLFRRIMDIMRAIPEIAIAFHTGGALGKLFSEVNENADLKPVEGLQSVGATWSQRMMLGVIPQVAPNYLSYALLRFEINIRASAILGFVGAGGIGYELKNAMSWGQGKYDEAAAIFVLLFAAIVFFDQLSSHFRNRLTSGGHA